MGRNKQSDIEKTMNKFTVYIVSAMMVITTALALLGAFWHRSASEKVEKEMEISGIDESLTVVSDDPIHYYLNFDQTSVIEGVFTFVIYFQILGLFLPISLFVSVEILKATIAIFIFFDYRLISQERCRGTTVKNMSIIEDLGMLHYIFADKTGTLTRN